MKPAPNIDGDYKDDLDGAAGAARRACSSRNIVHKKKAIIVCEGWDAAGKGGAIQRLTAECDPRAYQVWPIAAPTEEEKAHHYLWRFWQRLPAAGEIAIFDRSWYGRVLVERVEGFASEAEWRRAYDEINEFEAQLSYRRHDHRQALLPRHPGGAGRAPRRRGSTIPGSAGRSTRRISATARRAHDYLDAIERHVRRDRHALGAVDGDRRQRQEGRPHRRADPRRRGARRRRCPRIRRRSAPRSEQLAQAAQRMADRDQSGQRTLRSRQCSRSPTTLRIAHVEARGRRG